MSWPDWVQRHSAVSEEDFAKDASRNRFAVLRSRTNHLSYHLGQAAPERHPGAADAEVCSLPPERFCIPVEWLLAHPGIP
jgi:hypothetical protein